MSYELNTVVRHLWGCPILVDKGQDAGGKGQDAEDEEQDMEGTLLEAEDE